MDGPYRSEQRRRSQLAGSLSFCVHLRLHVLHQICRAQQLAHSYSPYRFPVFATVASAPRTYRTAVDLEQTKKLAL